MRVRSPSVSESCERVFKSIGISSSRLPDGSHFHGILSSEITIGEDKRMTTHKKRLIGRRAFAGSVAATALAGIMGTVVKAADRPNILFILADDLGWGDLSCYGRSDYKTPNLDRLAKQGLRFTDAYSASPVCTPTRCALFTGRYPARTRIGLEEPLSWRKQVGTRVGLSPDHPTLASLLKSSGYDTALVGKWHLGYLPKYGPLKSGFDEFFGILSGGADYFNYREANGEHDLYEGEVPVERIGYLTDLLTDRAIQFISKRGTSRQRRPFYLSLHYTAPHWPWEGVEDIEVSRNLKQGYAGFTAGGSPKIYASMMKSLDDGIGKVMKALDNTGLNENTLVIFTSDNGGERFSDNTNFSGQKFDLLEGGIRVPAIVRWLGQVPPDRVTCQTAITMDWTATILAAAGVKPAASHPMDGRDVLPVCRGELSGFSRTLFWRHGGQQAVRSGKWKYLRREGKEQLFDLSMDKSELSDRKIVDPETFQRLRNEFQKWNTTMLPQPEPSTD